MGWVRVTLPCAWAGCHSAAAVPHAGDLGVLWSWTCRAELKEAGWGGTGLGPWWQGALEPLWVPRGCSQGAGSLSGAVSLQAERHPLQLGMVPLCPVVRLR